jgi:hypothetical protein
MSLVSFWIAEGALTSVMTYCAIAAIHLVAMAANSEHGVVDLDIFPSYHVTMLALFVSPPVLMWSKALKKSSNIPVLLVWMVLLWIGVVSFTVMAKVLPESVPCVDSHGINITSKLELQLCSLNCTGFSSPMRSNQFAQVTIRPKFFYKSKNIIGITFVVTLFVLFGFVRAGTESPWDKGLKASNYYRRKYGGNTFWHTKEEVKKHTWPAKISLFAVLFWSPFMESTLRGLPYGEGSTAIGQWGPLLAFFLVPMAAALQRYYQRQVPTKPLPSSVGQRAPADPITYPIQQRVPISPLPLLDTTTITTTHPT